MWVFEISSSSFIPSRRAWLLHLVSNFCPFVGVSSRTLFLQLPFASWISPHISTHRLQGWSMERGVKRSPHKHLCTSKIRGWEWADGIRTESEDEAVERVRKVITKGQLQRKWHWEEKMIEFSLWYSYTHTRTLTCQSFLPVCGYFQSLRLPFTAHRSVLFLVFLFTCLIISLFNFCDWRILSINDLISSLFITLGPFPFSPSFSSAPTSLSTQLAASAFYLFVSHVLFSF